MGLEAGKQYYLLLLDIKDSSTLPIEALTKSMQLLEETLVTLNRSYRKQLSMKLTINYGDEIAGLLASPAPVYQIVKAIRSSLYPLTSVRFAVVYGSIAVMSKDIRKVGGSAFKQADTALTELKKKKQFAYWNTGNAAYDHALCSLSNISNVLLEDMSSYQREVYALLEEGYTQTEMAVALGKYQQSVWDAVHRSKALYIQDCEAAINTLLAQVN